MAAASKIDYVLIVKCMATSGLIVSSSVVADNAFGLFRVFLIGLYTSESAGVKLRLPASGGILPHTGSAGCYIYSGLMSYLILAKIKGKNTNQLKHYLVILIFVFSAVLIQKRGFIVDLALAVILIKVLETRIEDLKEINVQKFLKCLFTLVLLVIIMIVLYYKVPLMRNSLDALINKFTEQDETLSGRTDLYAFAFQLVRENTLTGIGWGRFRLHTKGFFGRDDLSYEVHNVYIQLFCETGIIGLGVFLIAAISSLLYGIKKFRLFVKAEVYCKERYVVELGLILQTFFLGYCMSGNPLYDCNFSITYFIGIMMTLIPLEMERE